MADATAGAASSLGRVRAVNEDAWYAGEYLFVVADGMGGHSAGDVASSLTIDALIPLDRPHVTIDDVGGALHEANEAVLTYAEANPQAAGLGTTACGLVAADDGWLIFNVGDSRCYAVAHGLLRQVTVDHSEVQELVDAGELTAEQARVHPQRNVITRAVGQFSGPVIDYFTIGRGEGVRFLLATDGLTTELSDGEIAALCARAGDTQQTADQLTEAAEQAGGRDNITVLVVDDLREVHDAAGSPRSTVPRQLIIREAAR